MANDKVLQITFKEKDYPEVLRIANELAPLLDRNVHDALRFLIVEAGQAKIEKLKKAKEAKV